jgi:hypothetical protein
MPKPEAVARVLEEIAKGYAQYRYFFENLNSPAWLEPLGRNGFFQCPPEPKPEGNYVILANWPESKYLVRMSKVPEAQEKVLDIVLRIPHSENGRVHDDVVDIALSLSPVLSGKLVPQICRYTESHTKLLLSEKIADLIVHLARGRQRNAALQLTGAALALTPAPQTDEKDGELISRAAEPQARFGEWYYARILNKALPSLLESSPLDAFDLVCGLLNDAARFSFKNDEGEVEDYFYVRQPAIEVGAGRDDIPSLLLCAARDAAVQIISDDARHFAAVRAILQLHRWTSFRRLELHITRVFLPQGIPTAELFFADPTVLENPGLRHEAVLLLKDSFSKLTAVTQQKILDWMDAGPSEESIRRFLELGGQSVTDEKISQISSVRRRDFLSILEGQLPAQYQQIYRALTNTMGPANSPERLPFRTFGAVGAQSPKTAADLAGMAIDDLIEYLISWTPGTDIFASTAEGLGSALTPTVSQRSAEFIAVAGRFKTLDPTYVRSFFAGLTAALKQGAKFDWKPVLELATWVSNQPRGIQGRKGGLMVADPDWGWTRDSVLDLLKAGFQVGEDRLPYEHREFVWRALVPLTDDPFPSLEDERGEGFDPSFLSINSTRGRSLFTTMEYAQWVRKCENVRKPMQGLRLTLDAMPEVRKVLDRHLDFSKEPTLAIRSIYGQELTWLADLDWEWLRANVPRILPLGQADSAYFNAAWEGFVVFNQPNDALLRELIPAYKKAIADINAPRTTRSPASPVGSLADHLMAYYWRDHLRFEANDQLLEDFYALAPDSVRGHATWFIGRSLSGWNENAPPEIFERLRNLMDRRLKAAEVSASPADFTKELASFGWWFTSNKLGEEWSIRTLLRILRLTKKINDEMDVVKLLATFSHKHPNECIACLTLMVEGDRDQWIVVGAEAEARRTIEVGLTSGSPDAVIAGRRLIELLIGRGQYGFRNLLR